MTRRDVRAGPRVVTPASCRSPDPFSHETLQLKGRTRSVRVAAEDEISLVTSSPSDSRMVVRDQLVGVPAAST